MLNGVFPTLSTMHMLSKLVYLGLLAKMSVWHIEYNTRLDTLRSAWDDFIHYEVNKVTQDGYLRLENLEYCIIIARNSSSCLKRWPASHI